MKNKRKKNNLFILILLLTFLLIVTRGFSYARYASNAVFNYYLSSKGFYFDSEDLSYDTKQNVNTLWDGDKVYFTLSNSSNDALSSEVDIKYNVSCVINEDETTKKCLINGTGTNEMTAILSASYGCSDGVSITEDTCIASSGEWSSKPASSTLYFEVVDESGEEVLNANVTLTVTSIEPYKKTLSAEYILIRDTSAIGNLSMKYEEGLIKSKLIVTNSYNENKCVLISWDTAHFIFDTNTTEYSGTTSDEDGNINSVYFNLNKMDSTRLEFYLRDTSTKYNELYFNLVESNMCE